MASIGGGNANNSDNSSMKFDERSPKTKSHIEQVLEKAVKRFKDSIRYFQFVENYPEIYKKDADCLKASYEQFTFKLTTRLIGETQQLLEEDNVNGLLEELDHISNTEPKSQAKAWRPSGNPGQDIKPHLTASKLEHRERLRKILDDFMTRETAAKSENAALRLKLDGLRVMLDEQLLKFESAASTCQSLPRLDMETFISSCNKNVVHFEKNSENKN